MKRGDALCSWYDKSRLKSFPMTLHILPLYVQTETLRCSVCYPSAKNQTKANPHDAPLFPRGMPGAVQKDVALPLCVAPRRVDWVQDGGGQHFRRSIGQVHGVRRGSVPLEQIEAVLPMIRIQNNFPFGEDFRDVVPRVIWRCRSAWIRVQLSAVDFQRMQNKRSIRRQHEGTVLPLHQRHRTRRGRS